MDVSIAYKPAHIIDSHTQFLHQIVSTEELRGTGDSSSKAAIEEKQKQREEVARKRWEKGNTERGNKKARNNTRVSNQLSTVMYNRTQYFSDCCCSELSQAMPEMDPTASSTVSERSHPSCCKPHLRTSSSFELPDMLKSADTVMEENRSLWTLSSVGKLAIRLARQSFFGDSILVFYCHRPALDPAKMTSSQHQCMSLAVPRTNNAVAGIRNRLRST